MRLKREVALRRQAEAALQETKRRWRALLDAAPLGIVLTSREGNVLKANRHMRQMLGLTAREMLSANAAAHYANPASRRELMARLAATGQAVEWEAKLRRKDARTIEARALVTSTQVGNERVLLSFVRDITVKKRAERRLEGINALLHLFAKRSSLSAYLRAAVRLLRGWAKCGAVGIRLIDGSRRLPYIAHSGFTRAFLKSENDRRLDRAGCACFRAVAGAGQHSNSCLGARADGFLCGATSQCAASLRPRSDPGAVLSCVEHGYESIATVVIRHHGRALGSIHLADTRRGCFSDEVFDFLEAAARLIGEAAHRFAVEQSLHDSERRFRALFQSHHSMMLVVQPRSGYIVDANHAAAAFYGWSRRQLCSKTIGDLGIRCPRRHAAARFESSTILRNQQERTVEIHASRLRTNGGQIWFCIIHDVTERKHLERLVVDIGEQERQNVGRDLHDFLGGRLAGAALMSKALARQMARKSASGARLADELVQCLNDSITLTRSIVRGLCPVEASPAGLVAGLEHLAAQTTAHFGIACEAKVSEGLNIQDPATIASLYRIAQEAVTNAVKHARPTRISICLRARQGQVELEVNDNGRGIRLKRGEPEGMGLRIMKYRARALGGNYAAQLRPGGGTAIVCRVPAVIEQTRV